MVQERRDDCQDNSMEQTREMRLSRTQKSVFMTSSIDVSMYLRLGTTLTHFVESFLKWFKILHFSLVILSAEGLLGRNGRQDKNETLVVLDDVNRVFIAVASLTDGYPVSARIPLPLAPPSEEEITLLQSLLHPWKALTVKKQFL